MSKPKYFLYARKSTEDDDKQVMSIEAQLFELREYARKENLEILEEFQESKSAKSPGREVFGKMMMRIERGDANGVIAWHPDRLARNSIDGGRIIYGVDTSQIISLRFPTFWFEPTPQGLFMLQVAFGQSKYYSDNLKQNVERGFRQKLRRGEWLTRAPFGYVNNPKTRNIEPDVMKSRVVVRAYEEYAKGSHTLLSMMQFLAEHGVCTKAGTPLGKASVARLLSNRAYLGFTKHHNEFFPGSFAPILSPTLFEAVQKKLHERARPRHSKISHNFPFTGLFRCGECGSMITAQWATNRWGSKYRYYRCTKKNGKCSQGYLQEDALAMQTKEHLQSVSLSETWTAYMLHKVEAWEKEDVHASGTHALRIKDDVKKLEAKMDALVDLHLNGDIERETYLKKKDVLMRQKLSLQAKSTSARHERKNWIEPLRKWILDSKRAGFLARSTNYAEIREFVRSFGTNPSMHNKTISISFCPPSQFARTRIAKFAPAPHSPPKEDADFSLTPAEVSVCDLTGSRTPVLCLKSKRPNR
ncbi:MAG: Recombinase [Candidatus Magasanikbacteria bacterium GW2011_GWA2_42_32]|uniref:Recombinase n=1 Tax=Candidatus Magasanikbacteria bacterium GW2011_GWA2_42_32 TaxID=1619039 RepID=A0A0G1CZB9_9BACT|nr:MAG: Recombinase [Candidatus Magasanikbacteria bacterium GW2011_GWA2_42_32]